MIAMFQHIGDAFKEGGWGMWPILAILLIALTLAVERVLYLLKSSFDARAFIGQLGAVLRSGNVAGAVSLCQQTDKPLARILAAGLQRGNEGIHRVQAAMDEAGYSEIPRIEKRTGYLALLGNVATLSGLLGTITGLIKSFAGISKEQASDKAAALAAGISEAMNCTAFGLLTGIAALLAYSVLNGKTQSLMDEINHLSLQGFRMWREAAAKQDDFVRKPIVAPAPHLMHHVGLGKKKGGRHKKSTFASLQLTPMIDMFIVVLIFLLMTFSAEGQIEMITKDVKLPFADMVEKLARAPVISISFPEGDPAGGVITLEGVEVSTAKDVRDDESPDWKIAKLSEQLEILKHNWKLTNQDKQFPGEVIVNADQNVDFRIVKKVMYSCGLAGYSSVHFAVTQKTAKAGET